MFSSCQGQQLVHLFPRSQCRCFCRLYRTTLPAFSSTVLNERLGTNCKYRIDSHSCIDNERILFLMLRTEVLKGLRCKTCSCERSTLSSKRCVLGNNKSTHKQKGQFLFRKGVGTSNLWALGNVRKLCSPPPNEIIKKLLPLKEYCILLTVEQIYNWRMPSSGMMAFQWLE
jgi:hypothetical protein